MFIHCLKTNNAAPTYTLAGKLQHFLAVWKTLTKGQGLLLLVGGYKIPVLNVPLQIATPNPLNWNRDQRILMYMEVK